MEWFLFLTISLIHFLNFTANYCNGNDEEKSQHRRLIQTGLLTTEPTNVGFSFLKITPESVLMNRINHKVFHIHLADKIEFYPSKIA